jgi:hypothetical protein
MRHLVLLVCISLSVCEVTAADFSSKLGGFWIVTGTGTNEAGSSVAIREFLRIGATFNDAHEVAVGDVFGGMTTSPGEGQWNQLSYFTDPNDIGFSFVSAAWNSTFIGLRTCVIRAHLNSATTFTGNFQSSIVDAGGNVISSVSGTVQGVQSPIVVSAFDDASKLPPATSP